MSRVPKSATSPTTTPVKIIGLSHVVFLAGTNSMFAFAITSG